MQREKLIDLRRMGQRDTAEAHAVDPRTIRRWTRLGMPRNPDETYDLAETIAWRCAHSDQYGNVYAATHYHWR